MNLTYTIYTEESKGSAANRLLHHEIFGNLSGKNHGKITEFCFHGILGTLSFIFDLVHEKWLNRLASV